MKSSNVKNEVGTYEVTLGIDEDAELTKTIQVTVVEDRGNVFEDGVYSLSTATQATVKVGSTDTNDILRAAGATATNAAGTNVAVVVKESNVENAVGDYQVVLGVNESSEIKVTVNVTVIDSEENTRKKIISADNISTEFSPEGISDEQILELSHAKILDVFTGEQVYNKRVYVKSNTIENAVGTYEVTLAVDDAAIDDQVITVGVEASASEMPEAPAISQLSVKTDVDEVTLDISQADEYFVTMAANPVIWNNATSQVENIPVYVTASNLEEKVGTYQITFGTDDASISEKTVIVTISDSSTEPGEPETPEDSRYSIVTDSDEFTLPIGSTNDSFIMMVANPAVMDNTTSLLDFSKAVYITSSNVENKAGTYQVTLGTDDSSIPEKTITVTVIGGATNPAEPEELGTPESAFSIVTDTDEVILPVGFVDEYSITVMANARVQNNNNGQTDIYTPVSIKSSKCRR